MDNHVKKQIEAFMLARNMNQAEFARASKIGKGTLSLILSGTTTPDKMTAGTLDALAKAIGIGMQQLFSGRAPNEVDSLAQFQNDLEALRIVSRSLAKALNSNLQRAGSDLAVAIVDDANDPARAKPFETDSGLLVEVLSILGRAAPNAGGASPPSAHGGSAR